MGTPELGMKKEKKLLSKQSLRVSFDDTDMGVKQHEPSIKSSTPGISFLNFYIIPKNEIIRELKCFYSLSVKFKSQNENS